MSEIQPNTNENVEQTKELSSEIQNALALEDVLQKLLEASQITKTACFATEEIAADAARAFVNRAIKELNTVPNALSIDLTVAGYGIQVPDVSLNQVSNRMEDDLGEQKGAFASIDPEDPFRTLLPFETMPARVFSILAQVKAVNDLEYSVHPVLVVDIGQIERHTQNISVGSVEIPMIVTSVFKRGLVYLNEDAVIEVDVLSEMRKEQMIKNAYSQSGLAAKPFSKYLNKLSTALRSETNEGYIPIRDRKIIRVLGEYGAKYARQGEEHADVAAKTILHGFGQDRPLEVFYKNDSGEEETGVKGRLIEVLLPASKDDSSRAALVIESSPAENNVAPVAVVPMESITNIKF